MEEVGLLTSSMFAALCKQRTAELKRQVWLQNMVVAAVFNAQRTSSDQHYFIPWDFMPDPNRDQERDEIIRVLRGIVMDINTKWTPEGIEKFKAHWTKVLTEKGRSDVGLILDKVLKGVG